MNEWLARVKEKQSTIKLDGFVFSFIFFIPVYPASSFITTHQISAAYAGECACDHRHQMEKTD